MNFPFKKTHMDEDNTFLEIINEISVLVRSLVNMCWSVKHVGAQILMTFHEPHNSVWIRWTVNVCVAC